MGVYRPLLLGPKSISMPSLVLIEKLSTTGKCSFKMEYPSKNIALDINDSKLSEEKENNSQKSRHRMPYSQEEIKVILDFVDRFGSNSSTFILLEEELDRDWRNIQNKYNVFMNPPSRNIVPPDARRRYRRFSKADDERIMNYIKEHGQHSSVFHALTAELNCRYVHEVKKRFIKLTTESEGPKIEMARNIDPAHHTLSSTLPNVIKSPFLEKPKNSKKPYWKKELLGYIIKNRIENKEDVDVYTIEKEVCPGQTVSSIKQFLGDLKNKKGAKAEPFYKVCKRRLIAMRNPGVNDFMRSFSLGVVQIEEIVKHYETIKKRLEIDQAIKFSR